MAYSKTVWQDLPSTNTPLSASNLNKIENELEFLDNSFIEEQELLGTGGIDGNLTTITISNIDLSLYKAITVKIGSPNEGDSRIFLIASNGSIVNDIVHFDMFAGDNYHCKGFASLTITSGTTGSVSITPRQLVGWGSVGVEVRGLKR